jgi:hypothetical protein
MLHLILLICLIGALAGYLFFRKTPRPIFFGVFFFATWIYAISFWMTAGILGQFSDALANGVCPYLAPIIPVVLFVGWFLRGTKGKKR